MPRRVDAAKVDSLFELIAAGHTVQHACSEVGIGRATAYRLRDDDRKRWDEAEAAGVEVLEQEVRRRAVDGVERTKWGKDGEVLGVETHYSDTLLIFLLKAKKPGTYRDYFRHEHVGGDGGPIVVEEKVDVRGVLRGLVDRGLIGPGANGSGDPEADEVHTA